MDIAIFLVQLGLVGAALWYSYETRELRKQNLKEIHVLMNQGRLALAPFLVPGAQKVSADKLVEMIQADEEADEEEKEKRIESARNEEVFFAVQIDNPTADKVGCHIEPYIYDPSTKSFLIPDHGKEWISPKETEFVQVTGPYVTKVQIEKAVRKTFGNVVEPLLEELDMPDDLGYIALFFQDVEGTLYLSKRTFRLKDGQILHHPTKLVCASI